MSVLHSYIYEICPLSKHSWRRKVFKMTDFVAVTEVSSNDLISHPHYVTPPTNGDGISAFARSEGNRIETIHHDDKKAHNSLTTTEREKIVGDNAHNSSSTLDIDSSQRLVLRIDIPAKKNQDRGRHWVLPGDVFVYAVADGINDIVVLLSFSEMCW